MAWEAGALFNLQPRDEDAPERRAGASY
jgi:hypothetical protein